MSPVFVDTNVLLYTFDDAYPDKRDQARAWVSACCCNAEAACPPRC